MEYQKITNLLDDSPNKTSKFRTKIWVEINDKSRGTCNDDKQIRFKTTMLKSTIPHINSETNPPSSMINVVCKYLRQFLGTRFGVATLSISCNIE